MLRCSTSFKVMLAGLEQSQTNVPNRAHSMTDSRRLHNRLLTLCVLQQVPQQQQAAPPQQQALSTQQPRPSAGTAASPASVKPDTPGAKPEAQCDWKEFTAPDGRKYYHNRKTKESKWHMPDELRDFQAAKAAAAASVQVPSLDTTFTMVITRPAGGERSNVAKG